MIHSQESSNVIPSLQGGTLQPVHTQTLQIRYAAWSTARHWDSSDTRSKHSLSGFSHRA